MSTSRNHIDIVEHLIKSGADINSGNQHPLVWNKSIQNPEEIPWLDLIEKRIKKYEGRIRKEDWTKIMVGDVINFNSGTKTVKTIVTELRYYPDFKEAFCDLGQELVPISEITPDEVAKLYSQYFSSEFIKEYGVVAVGVKVID